VFVLKGSTVRSAVIVATTAAEPHPRACGWTVPSGWLHPMDTAELRQAIIPSPGVRAEEREVHTAPALPLPGSDEESAGPGHRVPARLPQSGIPAGQHVGRPV